MTLVFGDLYRALVAAGADEAKAMSAAAEVYEATRGRGRPWHAHLPVSTLILVYMSGILTGLTAAALLLLGR